MSKKLFASIVGLLVLASFVLTVSTNFSVPVTNAATLTADYEFDNASDYTYPAGSVEFVTVSGDTVARRGDPGTYNCSYVQNKDGIPFDGIASFAVDHSQYGGSAPADLVKIVLSPDGENWYYYDSGTSAWESADVSSGCFIGGSTTITGAMLSDFNTDFGPGMLYFRAYMGYGDLGGGSYVVPIVNKLTIDYYEATECVDASACGADQYCKKPAGMCAETGVCAPAPSICPLILAPVCGCDGETYSSSCNAAMAGVAVDHNGECPAPTCTDGIQNQDETGVDCGGVCAACAVDTGFVDVPADYPHATAISTLKDQGVISGYDATHFGPELSLRRGELLKIALNGADINTDAYLHSENPYSDLPDDHTLKQFILYAYYNDIATGYGDGRFGPDNFSTQAEASKMLLNVNDIDEETAPAGTTYGLPEGDLRNYVYTAMEMNLLYNPAGFIASNIITRGYAAEIMYRILWIYDADADVFEG